MLKDINNVNDITDKDYLRYLELMNAANTRSNPLKLLFTALWMVPIGFLTLGIAAAITSAATALIVAAVGTGLTLPVSTLITIKSKDIRKEINAEVKRDLNEIKELKKNGQWDRLHNLMKLYVKMGIRPIDEKKLHVNNQKTEKEIAEQVSIENDGTIQLQ